MTGQGWTTGGDVRSKPTTKEYRSNYEGINWRRRKQVIKEWEDYQEHCESQREPLGNGNRP